MNIPSTIASGIIVAALVLSSIITTAAPVNADHGGSATSRHCTVTREVKLEKGKTFRWAGK